MARSHLLVFPKKLRQFGFSEKRFSLASRITKKKGKTTPAQFLRIITFPMKYRPLA